ncbi:MAG: NgoMIV family type II restriction endonuclease [Propionibacteriaceae bacterium]
MSSLLTSQRSTFHAELVAGGTLSITDGVASNADGSQQTSKAIALHVAEALGANQASHKLSGQSAGKAFEAAVRNFLEATFPFLGALRPGNWQVINVGGSRAEYHLARFEPYLHLDDLARAVERDQTLVSVLGNSYSISPDVFITRMPEPDSMINDGQAFPLVDRTAGNRSVIRAANQSRGIVHAVVSCKWTIRSDRAQNARSEALNIIRNRKGRTPHIAVVTGEPTPSRLASLALGTGDIDMVYHFALPELIDAVTASGNDEAEAMLRTLVDGKRLRDIADLPLDLCV